MSQFETRYTERQWRAVASAQLDLGMTGPAAVAAFNAGELRDKDGFIPPAANPMPKSSGYWMRRRLLKEREGIEMRAKVRTAAPPAELARRLGVVAERLVKAVERDQQQKNGTREQLADRASKAAKLVREVALAQKATADPKPPKAVGTTNGAKAEPERVASPLDDVAAAIASEARSQAARRRQSPTQQQ